MQFFELGRRLFDLIFDIKPQIKRGLIVPAPRSVQFCASFADFLAERALNIHVHVLERFVPLKFSGLDFLFDRAQSSFDLFLFRDGDNSGFHQRSDMSNRAGNIVPIKPMVEGYGFAVALRDVGYGFMKSSFSHD